MGAKLETIRTSEIDFSNVSKIYHGANEGCRCGCRGEYFDTTSSEFANKVSAIKRLGEVDAQVTERYINIPIRNNKAYTVYF